LYKVLSGMGVKGVSPHFNETVTNLVLSTNHNMLTRVPDSNFGARGRASLIAPAFSSSD
jgi:hypothetical protein